MTPEWRRTLGPAQRGLFHQNWGIPAYKRELEATYASFHRFLTSVQAVVVRRLQE